MKRCLLLLAVLAVASGLSAQESQQYTQEEVLAVFAQYNPAVLEKAKTNEQYNEILQKLASAYQKDKTEEAESELIALAKILTIPFACSSLPKRMKTALPCSKCLI